MTDCRAMGGSEDLMAAMSNVRLQWARPAEPIAAAVLALDSIPSAAALVNSEGVVLNANAEWSAAHPNALPGASAVEWCAAELREAVLFAVNNVVAGAATRFTKEYTASDAHSRRLCVTPAGPAALIVDIDLTAADDQSRRQRAEKMETVGRLVGGVAHDFANVLTMIAGYCDIVLSRIGEKDPLRGEIDEIRKAANRGARLTSQLLGFTRGQAVQPRPLDLNGVVADLQRMLTLVIGEYVDLKTELSPHLGKVVADPGQMEQVIMNLILNARDAMPAGGHIVIETANGDVDDAVAREHGIRPGPCVTLSISDTGHGIDAESKEHIFEPFFTTKDQGKGTGLGLSTVHRIVKESGGDVWVDSAPGQGATFTICLPATRQVADRGDVTTAPRPTPAGSETLLLVEDEEGVRKLLTHVLHKRGYRVIEASNGEEALRLFGSLGSEIDLVLTDMVMPRMSGRQLGEQLRRLRPDLKIIYMSGYTDDVLVRTGALGPGMSFLQKPLRPEVLAAKVREALDGAAAKRA